MKRQIYFDLNSQNKLCQLSRPSCKFFCDDVTKAVRHRTWSRAKFDVINEWLWQKKLKKKKKKTWKKKRLKSAGGADWNAKTKSKWFVLNPQ